MRVNAITLDNTITRVNFMTRINTIPQINAIKQVNTITCGNAITGVNAITRVNTITRGLFGDRGATAAVGITYSRSWIGWMCRALCPKSGPAPGWQCKPGMRGSFHRTTSPALNHLHFSPFPFLTFTSPKDYSLRVFSKCHLILIVFVFSRHSSFSST